MLLLQAVFGIEFGVFLQRLGPMEVVGSLSPIDGNLWIFEPVANSHGIPIAHCPPLIL